MDFNFEIPNGKVDEKMDMLAHIVLKAYEVDLVAVIGAFNFKLDKIILKSPDIRGYEQICDTKEEVKFQLMKGPEAE